MEIRVFALLFIIIITSLVLITIANRSKQSQLLREVGYKTTGKLVKLKRYAEKRGRTKSYYYVADYEYYCQGDKYNLRDIKYQFIGKSGDIENELGQEVEIIYLENKPKVARTSYQLSEPNTLKFEVVFIMIVTIPLFIGVLLSIIL